MTQKGFAPIIVILGTLLVSVIVIGIYFAKKGYELKFPQEFQNNLNQLLGGDSYIVEDPQTHGQNVRFRSKDCREDADCVLVQDKLCGVTYAINKNFKTSSWEKREIERAKGAREKRQTCKPTTQEYLLMKNFIAVCENFQCRSKSIINNNP